MHFHSNRYIYQFLQTFHQDNHVEAPEELPNKTKVFFAQAAENWDAEYYAKVNDDVYVNIGRSKVQLLANSLHD